MADNNYNTQNNTNPGFVTGNNTVPGQQGGESVGGGGFDLGQWLQSVVQNINTPNQNGSSQGGMATAQPNAYQKGVNKALQDAGTAHATQAIQSGVDPNDIVNHPIMGNNQDPTQILAGLAAMAQHTGGNQQTQPTQQQPQPSVDDQIASINKQSQLALANKTNSMANQNNFWSRFTDNVNSMEGGVTQANKLQNIEAMQKIAGGEPLQPKDVAEFNAGTYKAALEASHQAATVEATKLPALIDLYGKLQATRGFAAGVTGTASKEQNQVISALSTASSNLNSHISNLQTLINNRPTFSSKGIDKQSQTTANKIQEGQTATNNKTGQKIIYKGGKWIPQQ